jgi:two-component system cell cycle response regulator DivK
LLRLAGILVLVVDHEPRNARLLLKLLANEGCEVKIARSAEEAFLVLGTFPAQLIVLDLVLPRMSGLLFVQQLKAAPSTRDIVVVALSTVNGSEVERLAMEAGCVAYIRRPIDVHTFARTVAGYLGGKA